MVKTAKSTLRCLFCLLTLRTGNLAAHSPLGLAGVTFTRVMRAGSDYSRIIGLHWYGAFSLRRPFGRCIQTDNEQTRNHP